MKVLILTGPDSESQRAVSRALQLAFTARGDTCLVVGALALACHALGFCQCRRFAFEFFRCALELGSQRLDIFLATGKFLFEFCLSEFGRVGVAQYSFQIHVSDSEILRERCHRSKTQGDSHENIAVEHAREGLH